MYKSYNYTSLSCLLCYIDIYLIRTCVINPIIWCHSFLLVNYPLRIKNKKLLYIYPHIYHFRCFLFLYVDRSESIPGIKFFSFEGIPSFHGSKDLLAIIFHNFFCFFFWVGVIKISLFCLPF